ncbi:NAD(P)-binding protein [Apiospora rasikravindrae]|uniref:NAD(P)-binding protein n=1 Tax=Apiospora rasikravindrae TaxID=990691 RepID=A0ABR1TA65_9PEZI
MPDFDTTPEQRATQGAFFKRQLRVTPPAVKPGEVDISGKTAIITGANTGLGFACARQLLDLGIARLILAVRNESSGQDARAELLGASKRQAGLTPSTVVEVWPLDLASYESITSFANRARGLDRLDIFVNNAGITKKDFLLNRTTGHEEMVQVNYLSLVLLTVLMLPILRDKNKDNASSPGRIVNVNSDVASWAKFQEREGPPPSLLAAVDDRAQFDNMDRYYTTKLLGQFFLAELAKRVPPTVAVVNAPNPGLCRSGLQRDFDGTVAGFLFGVFKRLFARTVDIGARALTDAAVRHGAESHGQFLEDCKIQPMAPIVYKPEGIKLAEQLWKETMQELEFVKAAEIIEGLSDKIDNSPT